MFRRGSENVRPEPGTLLVWAGGWEDVVVVLGGWLVTGLVGLLGEEVEVVVAGPLTVTVAETVAVTGGLVPSEGVAAQVETCRPIVRDAMPSLPRGSLNPAGTVPT